MDLRFIKTNRGAKYIKPFIEFNARNKSLLKKCTDFYCVFYKSLVLKYPQPFALKTKSSIALFNLLNNFQNLFPKYTNKVYFKLKM